MRRFVAEGASVLINDLLDDLGEAVAAELGSAALFWHQDVTSRESWGDIVAAAEAAFGKVGALVDNAGVLVFSGFENYSDSQIDTLVGVNVKGVI